MRGVVIGLLFFTTVCGVALIWRGHPDNASMDFIERHLGYSPDGGDGSLEILILIAAAMIVGAIGLSRRSPVK